MRIIFINHDCGGYADDVEVAAGTPPGKFFSQQVAGGRAEDDLIRVNRRPIAPAAPPPRRAPSSPFPGRRLRVRLWSGGPGIRLAARTFRPGRFSPATCPKIGGQCIELHDSMGKSGGSVLNSTIP
jgi:hypothetical protein